jgi:hypothetical protein
VTSLLESALALEEAGFSVFPLAPRSKRPRIEWGHYQTKRMTPAELMAHWEQSPDDNVAIVTGAISGIIVGDVDPRHGGDVAELDGTSGLVVKTGGGGRHYYYKHPGGRVPNRVNIKPGVDLRGDGGYVVAPHSIHESGGLYSFVGELTGAPGDAPTWLLEPEPAPTPVGGFGDPWIARALDEGVPMGEQAHTLARLAGYFASRELAPDVAAGMLWTWARGLDQNPLDPWRRENIERTVKSIYDRAARNPRTSFLIHDDTKAATKALERLIPLEQFIPRYLAEQASWLIPEWLPDRTIAFLISPPGTFKTWLTFDMAVSVASGWPFLGRYPINRPGPAIVLQQEDAFGDIAKRFSYIYASRMQKLPRLEHIEGDIFDFEPGDEIPPVYLRVTRDFTLDKPNIEWLEESIAKTGARLVVLDPLYSIVGTDDFMAGAANDLWPLKIMRDKYGCSFVIAAHTKKGATSARESLWGSQFLNAYMETGIQVRAMEGGPENSIWVRRHTKSAATFQPVMLTFNIDDDPDAERPYRVDIERTTYNPDEALKKHKDREEAAA